MENKNTIVMEKIKQKKWNLIVNKPPDQGPIHEPESYLSSAF